MGKGPIQKVGGPLVGLPPLWMTRVIAQAGHIGNSSEIRKKFRKLLGEPAPEEVDLDSIPPELAALFTEGGMLQKIRKKLEGMTKKQAKRIAAAKGRVACVDEDDVVYVGVDFLEKYQNSEDLIAGIMAHEWGHMVSTLPSLDDLDKMSLDELLELRRDEEAGADVFAGRVLYVMGYSVDDMIEFLKSLEKIKKKIKTKKYHPTEIREEILREAYKAQKKNEETAHKLFAATHWSLGSLMKSKLIGEG